MDPDRRTVRALNTPSVFRAPADAAAWRRRAIDLRTRVLAAAGLIPMPERPRIRARVTGTLAREGYRVENLWFESGRGLYVAGNLYLPEGRGPFPAVLHPHGHWMEGRAADDEDGSSQAFCIHLARTGYAAFAWDMIGFNDTQSLPHDFHDPKAARLGITLCGLQLWNSLRAVDFLAAHPSVDPARIGVAGASGGATQAVLLCAVDDRVAAAAHVCMVSCRMQGGCVCENAPGLRIGTDNVELAALMAPRPLLLVSATGDWTSRTPRDEGPAVRRVYRLLGQPGRFSVAHFRLPHNLLRESREAVYRFFATHLGGPPIRERAYAPEPVRALLTFPDGAPRSLPRGRRLLRLLSAEARGRARSDPSTLQVLAGIKMPCTRGGCPVRLSWMGAGKGATLVVHDGEPRFRGRGRAAIVDVHGVGRSRARDRRAAHARLARTLWKQLDRWSGSAEPPPPRIRILIEEYFDVYNRTDDALRIEDVLAAMAWLSWRGRLESIHARGRAAGWVRVALAILPMKVRLDVRGHAPLDLPCVDLLFPRG